MVWISDWVVGWVVCGFALWYGLLWWFGLCVNSVVHFIYIYVACHFILICVLFCVVDGSFGFGCVSLLGLIVVNACLVGCKLGFAFGCVWGCYVCVVGVVWVL